MKSPSGMRRATVQGLLAALMALASLTARAQQVQVSPNPAPLDAQLTIQGAGFPANQPVLLYWDLPQPQSLQSNMHLTNPASTNGAGQFSLTLDIPTFNAYPVTAGDHQLTYGWVGAGGEIQVRSIPVTLLPRQGWPSPPPIPGHTGQTLSGGVLAYLRYGADGASTSLMASNGSQEVTLGANAVGSLLFDQPSWSPDGSKIAYETQFDTAPMWNLYTLDVTNRRVTQVTDLGGAPPKLSGGGAGGVSGALLPYLGDPGQSILFGNGDAGCADMYKVVKDPNTGQYVRLPNDEYYPKGGFATLVGTGLVISAPLPAGQVNGDPFPFAFTNVPAGDYSLHLFTHQIVCQDDTVPQANGQTKQVQRKAAAVPNLTVPVHVDAGKVTQVQPLQVLSQYEVAQNGSWLSNNRLLYNRAGGVYEVAKGPATSDVWSATTGQAPTQITQTLTAGKITDLNASPANGLFAATTDPLIGIFYGDPATVVASTRLVTSWYALFAFSNGVGSADHYPAWDPSGNYLAFLRTFPQTNGSVGNVTLKQVATGVERFVTQFNLQSGEGAFGRPAWSPDGSQIAFTYTTDNVKTVNIRVVNVNDGNSFNLTSDGHSALPTWTGGANFATLPSNLSLAPRVELPAMKPGDLTKDGAVTVGDAVLGLLYIVQLKTPPADLLQVGDLDQNGTFNVADVTKILRIVVGI